MQNKKINNDPSTACLAGHGGHCRMIGTSWSGARVSLERGALPRTAERRPARCKASEATEGVSSALGQSPLEPRHLDRRRPRHKEPRRPSVAGNTRTEFAFHNVTANSLRPSRPLGL